MTVAELVDVLAGCDPDTQVRVLTPATRADAYTPERPVGDTVGRVDVGRHSALIVPALEDFR